MTNDELIGLLAKRSAESPVHHGWDRDPASGKLLAVCHGALSAEELRDLAKELDTLNNVVVDHE